MPVDVDTDIIGISRKLDDLYKDDNGNGTPPIVDMGAYEHTWFPLGPKISGGEFHTLLAKANGTVWACGDNLPYPLDGYYYGQLGLGGRVDDYILQEPTPAQVLDGNMPTRSCYLEKIAMLDAGYSHSLAIEQDGCVWAWGWNSFGQIGDGDPVGETEPSRTTPVQVLKGEKDASNPNVKYLKGIVKVAAGRSGQYSMALDSFGEVWTWGLNHWGQLGNGKSYYDYPQDLDYEKTPVQVLLSVGPPKQPLENIIDIDAGISHSIALDDTLPNGGYVWTWGRNLHGQLGNNSNVDSKVPVHVLEGQSQSSSGYLENIVDVAVCCGMTQDESSYDYGASYALDSAHNVWAWGSGTYGKLGQGNETDYLTPVKVQGLQNIIAISAGNEHVLALDSNHNVWAWGKNYYGQLGNGKSAIDYQSGLEYQSQPVQVMRNQSTPLTNIVYLDAGFEHSLAMDKDGNIWVWGRNSSYELGIGKHNASYPGYELTPRLMPNTK